MRELMYREAVQEALDEEMARDENVFVIGEDVGVIGGNFKCTTGLLEKYGDLRCKDSPISEAGIVGLGVGAAITGCRPVVELMFADFLMVAMDQICNQAAKITYMSGGQVKVPLVIRMPLGGGRSSAAQHSQSLHAWVAHCPGLKVVLPATAGEAKGLLKTAIRDNNPVIFFEHKMLYTVKFGDVPDKDEDFRIPFGKARQVTEGSDVTVVATSIMAVKAEKAAATLAKEGISVETIDPRTIVPLDTEAIIRSVKKTGRLLIVDEGHASFGISGEIALRILPEIFYDLEAPIERLGTADTPLPFSPALEFPLIPDEKSIAAKIREMARPGGKTA
ncbi:MAG: alpha-ketoacid dehydrogenase subunit beta [Desulfovibrio sp.]|jgi:pyruvate dehydrogenase E1 component beta subunit|nr:alpha-ketoacid dehydrogenase subunit beta [Desulfovibrio sp.]